MSGTLAEFERRASEISDHWDPFSQQKQQKGKMPFYNTGARSLIRIGGVNRTVANRIRWSISYAAVPIHTLDSPFAWDIDVGQVKIHASLDEFMSPVEGPEANAMFAIMKAAVHQPMVEMQVLDGFGTAIFFAKGMFVEVNGDVAVGRVSSWSAKFIGTQYQHYVSQNFRPYDSIAGAASNLVNGLRNLASDVSGGII